MGIGETGVDEMGKRNVHRVLVICLWETFPGTVWLDRITDCPDMTAVYRGCNYRCVWCGLKPHTGTCETSQVLLVGVPGGFSQGSLVFATGAA